MNKSPFFFIICSAIFYAIPYTFEPLYWVIFIFPIPLVYIGCQQNISFIHGYLWGFIVFSLHLRDGIAIIINLSENYWWIGVIMSMTMILLQALFPAILFFCAQKLIKFFDIKSFFVRLFLWGGVLFFFIFWVDRYSLWCFGIPEGYPLMHPLIVLTRKPDLLLLLPILGKQLLTILFLFTSVSFVLLLRYKNKKALLLFVSISCIWITSWLIGFKKEKRPFWYSYIKSLPYMIHSVGKNKEVTIKIIVQHIKNILTNNPETNIIIMPESALNIINLVDRPELLDFWNEKYIGKPIHIIFGTCRIDENICYNSLHWVHNGLLKECFDKKHTMLITEYLPNWMNYDFLRTLYFKRGFSINRSSNNRILLKISDDIQLVPYICSELFFNEYPDDCYDNIPIVAIVNDILLYKSFMQRLLIMLARFKAIQWQREIIYISYSNSVFITQHALAEEINHP